MARTQQGNSETAVSARTAKRRAPSPLSKARSENRKLREKLKAFELAGASGVAITVDLDDCLEQVHGILRPALVPVAKRFVKIAVSRVSKSEDAMKAGAWVFDREVGKVTDKVQHSGSIAGVALVCDFPVAGGPTPAAEPDPESGD